MKKGAEKKTQVQLVKEWYMSFVPLGIAAVLFVACFLLESVIWLYAICTAEFALFVILFVRANRKVAQKDGYTLIQAMDFYKKCRKTGIGTEQLESNFDDGLVEVAKQIEYADGMERKQLLRMYKCGERLYIQLYEPRK